MQSPTKFKNAVSWYKIKLGVKYRLCGLVCSGFRDSCWPVWGVPPRYPSVFDDFFLSSPGSGSALVFISGLDLTLLAYLLFTFTLHMVVHCVTLYPC